MLLARPYAESFYEVLKNDKEALKQVFQEYKWLVDTMKDNGPFKVFLETPSISRATKEAFLEKVLRGKCHDTFVNFLHLLAKKGRLFLLDEIYLQVQSFVELEGNKVRVLLTTAIALSGETKAKVSKFLETKLNAKIVLEEKIDSEILGGFVIRVEDTLMDGSLKSHLNKIKNSILERSKTYGI